MIGHLDVDYFYAQVEELLNPSLRSKPVVVCVFSGRTELSGVVSTSNYIARQYGVKSGMPIRKAKKLLEGKDAKFIPLDMEKYSNMSEKVMNTIRQEIGLVEVVSIDEAYFDLTEASRGEFSKSKEIALKLKEKIQSTTGLTTTIGIGPTKTVAKMASDMAKPNGLLVIDDLNAKEFIGKLPVEKLPGVGPKTKKILNDLGISSISQLASTDPTLLYRKIGKKVSIKLFRMANMIDDEPIKPSLPSDQIGRIITLKSDTNDEKQIMQEIENLIKNIQEKLKVKDYLFKSLAIIAITDDMKVHTRTKTYPFYINDITSVKNDIERLFAEFCKSSDRLIRRAGLKLFDLSKTRAQESISYYLGASDVS